MWPAIISSIIFAISAVITTFQFYFYKNNWLSITEEQKEVKYEGKKFPILRKFWIKDGWLILFIFTILVLVSTITLLLKI